MKDSFTNNFKPFLKTFLSRFVTTYRKKYSCNDVLMQLIENYKTAFDVNLHIGIVPTDLSKAFDCILYVLLIAMFCTYSYVRKQALFSTYT